MRLSTSTNIYAINRSGPLTDTIECMRRCADAGFKVLDFNFRFIKFDEFFLIRDDWEKEIEKIGNEAAKLGIEFSQSHIPYYNLDQKDKYLSDPELHEWFEKMCLRAYHASAALGVKWAVAHGFTAVEENCSLEASKKKNHDYFGPYIEVAKKLGIGLAIENMCDFYGSIIPRRYTATYEELVDLVDSFNDPSVGICWDFGHANLMEYDQCKALRYVGKRLKATHVNDNFGLLDVHTLPFAGKIKWEGIMKTLTEIGYEGDFTYEIHGFVDRMPEALKDSAVKFAYEVGQYLLSLA
ncbi:MAG TPA: sugar phosphate isomerase/epimerase family protein [Thermoclostridium sp.]